METTTAPDRRSPILGGRARPRRHPVAGGRPARCQHPDPLRPAHEYVGAARWTDPAEDADRIATARASAAGLEPFASGAYVNVLGDDGAAGVRRAYSPAKLTRLTALKDAVDPDNVFHLNQNIAPSGGGEAR